MAIFPLLLTMPATESPCAVQQLVLREAKIQSLNARWIRWKHMLLPMLYDTIDSPLRQCAGDLA